jgi:cytoskeletal protein CcmA (bactofilin family)
MGSKQNLVINGSGSYGGGAYHKVNIRGEGTITADFECEAFKTFGTSEALKNVKAVQYEVFGESKVRGDLSCESVKIFGTTEVGGHANIGMAKIFGTLEVGEGFSGEEANIKGSLSVKGDTEFETFKSTGSFEISGLLNVGTMEVSLRYDKSSAREIGGERIIVKKKSSILPFNKGEGMLVARLIEADEVFLENTKADMVRGKKVQIGAGCEIGVVEYTESIKVDPDATVRDNKNIR